MSELLISVLCFPPTAERNPPSPSGGEKLRWRKESFPWRNQQHQHHDSDRSTHHQASHHQDLHQESTTVEGHLAAEANMVVLDTLENIVQVWRKA